MRIGIDCGGVLLANYDRQTGRNIPFNESFFEYPEIDGAVESVKRLVDIFGQENVFLVSMVSEERRPGLLEWLKGIGLIGEDSFTESNLYFCRRNADKAGICSKLGITHFVDNRLEVLRHLSHVPHLYLLQPSQHEMDTFTASVPQIEFVAETWSELLENIAKASTALV
ncbi:MAG: hypothetical protein K0S20_633 [Patescibacteria group bacterium]|jgi:hypothetical protein|nr:hypothetical protein [Patescibacteria group bacterium]